MRISLVFTGLILFVSWTSAESTAPTAGEVLYRRGVLTSGSPVAGGRESGGSTSGVNAACVNCHRPSGLGTVEGRTVIPPITAKYLFRPGVTVGPGAAAHQVVHTGPSRMAYTDETLVRAIRDGVDPNGRQLDYLMPRYNLDDATMGSLIAYLKQLSSGPTPGVAEDTLHFATIITPDADPVKRKGMLDVLERFFAAKNAFYRPLPPPQRSTTRMMYHVPRKWQLHVWDLVGEPETWNGQLQKRLQSEPVFAVISGLGGKDWSPVHRFCEREALPCFFPNVDLPVDAERDFYDVYFSGGVLLEARLIAHRLQKEAKTSGMRCVVQVYREDDIGAAAAQSLHDALAASGIATMNRPVKPRADGDKLAAETETAGTKDALVLWLRPDDLRNLPIEPPRSAEVFVSGLMGGLEDSPIKGVWRGAARMAYPFELPERRAALLNYPLGWFKIQQIPVVAERTQVDTYVACGIVSENLGNMLDNFVRDYLLENVEVMLSTRVVNGYYKRFGLAPGQRFASKGGYIVRLAGEEGRKLVPEGDWIVP